MKGRAISQAVSGWLPNEVAQLKCVVNKETLAHVFSEHFGFPYQAFHQIFHSHHVSSRAGIIHLVASVTVDSVPLHQKNKEEKETYFSMRTTQK
jgi:hypothetical protein